MLILTPDLILKLIEIETQIRYDSLPPAGQAPFQVVAKKSPVLLSAPHGAITFRNSDQQIWHEEDEYTAGMALLLSEICGVSAIAMKQKCQEYDPNFTKRDDLPYKREILNLIDSQ